MSPRARRILSRRSLARPSTDVARDLLGTLLVRDSPDGRVVVRLVETEAYRQDDPGSHAFHGYTPRLEAMFGRPGLAYVYFTYGMHWCLNVSCEAEGVGAAVLLRAAAVVEGIETIRKRRGDAAPERDLVRGPARLTVALGVDRALYGVDLVDPASPLRLEDDGWRPPPDDVVTGPRVGVLDTRPWRWSMASAPEVSRYTPHARARRPVT